MVMKVIIEPGSSGNVIATIAIGGEYYNSWERYASPTWKKYCEHHGLGLIVFDNDMLSTESNLWKKRQWQKLLIGDELLKSMPTVRNVCYLDTDILINYTAPNVFDGYDEDTISLVSQNKSLPYPLESVLRRIAFSRHHFYSKEYPLDSALFMSLKQIYEFHQLEVQTDYTCTGFFVFNAQTHAPLMKEWFEKYDKTGASITDGGEEAHLNYELQNWGKISWMDYKWQALWIYEMAWKYPFLYHYDKINRSLIKECIEASLLTNYFLHFAGSWHESGMWKVGGFLESKKQQDLLDDYSAYLEMPVTGEPKGVIKP
jgi:hypothetical protein